MVTTDCMFKPSGPDASAITCLSVENNKPFQSPVHFIFTAVILFSIKSLLSYRFLCCLLVAIPLAATLYTAIIRWQQNKEVSPAAESLSLNSSLNVYGTLKNNDCTASEINPDILRQSADGKIKYQWTSQLTLIIQRHNISR